MFNLKRKKEEEELNKKLASMESKTIDMKKISKEEAQIKLNRHKKIITLTGELINFIYASKRSTLMNIQNNIETQESLSNDVNTFLKNKGIVDEDDCSEIKKRFYSYIFGYGLYDDLIADKDISDIRGISSMNTRIKKNGKRENANIKFATKEEYERFINIIALKNHINLADINAIQTFTDKEYSSDFILRIDICTNYVTSNCSTIHIRKIPKFKKSKEELINLKFATEEQLNYLENEFANGKSIICCGKGGSGKTTLMNYLLDVIPLDKSGLIIQENEELFSKHPELIFQRVRISKGENMINYGLSELATNGLLMDLDYFAIGEIKGKEAIFLPTASNTGHTCLVSVHSTTPQQAIEKIADYILEANPNQNRQDVLRNLSYIPIIVFLEDFSINEIVENNGENEFTTKFKKAD